MNALDTIFRYHQQTKHRFQGYARGPETLDWDSQPAPFRRFEGAPAVTLPLSAKRFEAPFDTLHAPACTARPAQPVSLDTMGALFQLSLAVSAWKSNGVDRWAVRSNPSSGNLHPTEAYLIACGVAGLADGVHHYRAEDHALELRAAFPAAASTTPVLFLGLSSVIWREAWKYGERAFRYCQLDVGHVVACLAYSAALLGWQLQELPGIAGPQLASLLGLDRMADFPAVVRPWTEREEADLLLALLPAPNLLPPDPGPLFALVEQAVWHGKASLIDKHPMYQWPVIDEVVAASVAGVTVPTAPAARPECPPLPALANGRGAVATILGRRSGQRYNARHAMPRTAFLHLLDATLARPQPPWTTLADAVNLALVLFVHRVEEFEPGLYLLVRDAATATDLPKRLNPQFAAAPRVEGPAHLDLRLLAPIDTAHLYRVARSISCHQDIAAMSCFSLGMLAKFGAALARDPARYRTLYWKAGLLGQTLYLEAEVLGYRGTGIGCFFDDPMHDLLGLTDTGWQSLYHFAIGLPVEDPRIESTPAYPAHRTQS